MLQNFKDIGVEYWKFLNICHMKYHSVWYNEGDPNTMYDNLIWLHVIF